MWRQWIIHSYSTWSWVRWLEVNQRYSIWILLDSKVVVKSPTAFYRVLMRLIARSGHTQCAFWAPKGPWVWTPQPDFVLQTKVHWGVTFYRPYPALSRILRSWYYFTLLKDCLECNFFPKGRVKIYRVPGPGPSTGGRRLFFEKN